jgi:hypothetical protein
MKDPASCQHEDFEGRCDVKRLTDVGQFLMEVQVACTQCGTPFRFLGLPPGLRFGAPTVSLVGTTAHLPIAPGQYPRAEFEQRAGSGLVFEMPPPPPPKESQS